MAEVKRRLAKTRLLTLTGTAGSGKTRLALEVAARRFADFEEGVWLIELAPLSDESLVPRQVASALGIKEEPRRALIETLANELEPKSLLLLLDNCEHLVLACAQLAERLLRTCPNLKILATSREALGVTGEAVWTVPPLSVPDLPRMANGLARTRGKALVSALLAYESVRLFVERASATFPDFQLMHENATVIAQICQRLDGIPLAIELAAARVRALPVQDIAERLNDRFRLLIGSSRTAAPRHQSLQAAIDWSYALLSEDEQVVLRRLSVFAGGWTLEAAEAVCAGGEVLRDETLDRLSQLVDKSLVIMREQAGKARFHMLETIRQYAWERLVDSGEAAAIRRRHAEYFLALAQETGPKLLGSGQMASVKRLEAEHDNLRMALAWSRSEPTGTEIGLRLAAAIAQFWQLRGYLSEGQAWLEALLSESRGAPAPVRAQALSRVGFLSGFAEPERGTAFLKKALALYRELRDSQGIIEQLYMLAWMAQFQGNYPQAVTHANQALTLAKEIGDKWGEAAALFCLEEVAYAQGDLVQATALLEESIALCREIGNLWALGRRLTRLGQIAHAQGDPQRALALIHEALVDCWQAGDTSGTVTAITGLAGIARAEGEPARAARLLGAAAALREATGTVLFPAFQSEYEREVAAVRAQLGASTFESAWEEGQAMRIEQVMAYAGFTPPAPLEEAPRPSLTPAQAAKQAYEGLTRREREVAALVAQGMSNREIATKLVVDIKTVEAHISRILNKLNLTSRTQIALWARNKGLG
jgi:non-specific serine/threonine protein kinase